MNYRCFVYQPDIHFFIPEQYKEIDRVLCYFATVNENNHISPSAAIFTETDNADDADVFLFPYDVKPFADISIQTVYEDIIRSLPFYRWNERRHIIFDTGDSNRIPDIACCLFKVSVQKGDEGRAVVLPYQVPDFILQNKPDFKFSHIKYDISFVGNITNPIRKFAALSIQTNTHLKSKIDIDDSVKVTYKNNEIYVHHEKRDQNYIQIRQMKYLAISNNSRCIYCPPGVGPQSIRMYEAIYLGRIPVLMDNGVVYPFSDAIDYTSFTFTIKNDRMMDIGDEIYSFISSHTHDELNEMCMYAHKAWQKWFNNRVLHANLMKQALKKNFLC